MGRKVLTHTHSGQEVSTRAKVLRLLHTNLRGGGGGGRGLIDCFKVGKWGGGGGGVEFLKHSCLSNRVG